MNTVFGTIARVSSVFLVTALALAAGRAIAQNNQDQLPPHVIDVSPYPGEEVPADMPVTVEFDQAMDRASVEAAWHMEPAAAVQFSWIDDQTVTFIPEGGWPRATRYMLTLGTGAQSAAGITLEAPYEFFVQTIGLLDVSTVIPAPGAEGVTADATITVSFNRPVVPLVSTDQIGDLPNPLTFEPAIDGKGEWINTSIYMFTPAQPLAGGTTYTAHVIAGLTDVLGATLDDTYTWTFKTLSPEVLNVTPYQGQTNVPLDNSITIQFSQPMDRASTAEAFMLQYQGERVRGDLTWSNDDRILTFTPSDRLAIDAVYLIALAPNARSASGEATIKEGLSYSFYTVPYPGIASTNPSNGERDVYPGGGATIYFKSPMNTDTFEGKAEIISPEGVTWDPIVYGNSSLTMDFATRPETTYTIRFKRGAEDIYGNVIQTDYTFSFTTARVEPWASLPSSDRFSLTNGRRENTRIAMGVNAKPTVAFALYQVDTANIGIAIRGYYDDLQKLPQVSTMIRAWTQQLDAGPTQFGVDEVLLASESGGQLPSGVYFLRAITPNSSYPQSLTLGVVTANLTVKRSPNEILVWVTDMESASPIADANVTLYRYDGTVLASGKTDADGVLDITGFSQEYVYIVAESETTYGVWSAWDTGTAPDTAGNVYTDRPIYRPGETVYFRGVVRDRQDMEYTVPHAEQVHVQIDVNYGSQSLFDDYLTLSEFGTFNGQVDLPDDVQLGQANISVTYQNKYPAQVSFTVAEFRVPEYKVEVTPDYSEIIQGDPLKAVIGASYYFGGAVSDADLTWNALGEPASFNYTGPGRYNFMDDSQSYFGQAGLGGATAKTDANGQVVADLTSTTAPTRRPMTITIEGDVTDESGQYISGRTTVLAHPANIYVGLRSDRYFGQENTPLNLDLIAVTPQSEPLADKTIELQIVEIRWERVPIEGAFGQYDWQSKEIPVETAKVTTASDGTAHYAFTPPNGGIFRVKALARDERERVNSSSLSFWVTGTRPVWWGRPSNNIDLVADKDSYQPGDTAEILIPTPFTGVSYALITTERMGIQHYEVVRVEGSTLVYKLPITENHVPTIYVSVALMKGTDTENLNPSYRTGSIALTVEPVNRRIEVTLVPSATLAQPGDTVSFDVKTVDAHGEPVSAEVGVTVTDLAILSLMPPNSSSFEDSFYGYQSDYVSTDVALRALLDIKTDEILKQQAERDAVEAPSSAPSPTMTAMAADGMVANEALAGGQPGGIEQVEIRQDFQQTPLWAPQVVTDQSGQASVSLTLPDNLTTWRVDARGVTTDTRVGDTELDVMSTLPLLTRPVTPRFFVVGDRVTLASVINNNTDAPQTVQATLQATGVTLESPTTQTVTIDAAGRARVEWIVDVQDVSYVDLTFFAIGADGYQDASKPTLATGPDGTIPVYRYTAPDTVGTGGMLRDEGSRTEAISLPPRLDTDQGELTIHLDPSLAVTTVDALDYLKNYKHQCIEQTVSRFLPNVMTYRALKGLGLDDPALESNLRAVLDEALARLTNEQNSDGGWGWFGTMESNPYVTAYAVLGLVEARDTGFDINAGMIDRAINFVRADFVRPSIDTPVWRLNRQAFYLYVFARAQQVSKADLDALLDKRLEMDYWALSFLLMAYHEAYPADPAVNSLVSDLQTAALVSATGTHWEEREMDWWNWSSDTRSTAIALAALTRVQPDMELLPNVVRWLMVARQGDHWETTQETAWAVMALTDWMQTTGELRGNYDYSLIVNGDGLADGTVTPDTVRDGQVIRVQVKDLLKDEINRVTINRNAGEGVLYYTAHLDMRLYAADAKPASRGITVSREYFLPDDPKTPVTAAKMGDVITVRVTMTLPQDIYYFVLEDPIPSGTEPVDTSLLTTSQLNQAPTIRPAYDPYWYWGWWLFDRTELHDDGANLYADFLPRGTYVYTYQIRATVPGEFQTMPSHAYAFYFPEVFGRGAGTLFTITPQ